MLNSWFRDSPLDVVGQLVSCPVNSLSFRAVSLRARLRCSFRNSWRDLRSAWLDPDAADGSASDSLAWARHCFDSSGYTPFSRHQALRPSSSRLAVWITASRRAGPVHSQSCESLGASARQRESVSVRTLVSVETASSVALSGGSKRATALALKAFEYLAMHQLRALCSVPIEGTTILTQRARVRARPI